METNLCEFFIGTNVVFNTRGFVQFFAFSTRKQCKVISQCEEKKLPLWPNAQSVLQQQRDSISSKSDSAVEMLFLYLVWAFLSFLFWFAKENVFLCELVLYYVENYGFYFNGLKKKKKARRALVAFLTWSQSLCSGLKKEKKMLQVWSEGVCV